MIFRSNKFLPRALSSRPENIRNRKVRETRTWAVKLNRTKITETMKTVGIIGGSGFIGSYTTKKFLQEGFKVRVSTTDISKPEKYGHLKSLPNAENLEIIPLNVVNKDQLKEFVNGCDIVVHGGTPFHSESTRVTLSVSI